MRAMALVLPLILAGCGADAITSPTPGGGGDRTARPVLVIAEGEPPDAGITVAEAVARQPADDMVTVTGALFVAADGSVLLCDAIAESFPPQCGGERIAVEGLDLSTVPLEAANGVRWAESVSLVGSLEQRAGAGAAHPLPASAGAPTGGVMDAPRALATTTAAAADHACGWHAAG